MKPTRQAFYERVVKVMNEEGISQPKAYEIVEQDYIKEHKERRYLNYRAFHWSNYSAMIREQNHRRKCKEITDRLHDLCEELRKKNISQPDFVATIKGIIFEK
jgi:uncharacterized protein YueI